LVAGIVSTIFLGFFKQEEFYLVSSLFFSKVSKRSVCFFFTNRLANSLLDSSFLFEYESKGLFTMVSQYALL